MIDYSESGRIVDFFSRNKSLADRNSAIKIMLAETTTQMMYFS